MIDLTSLMALSQGLDNGAALPDAGVASFADFLSAAKLSASDDGAAMPVGKTVRKDKAEDDPQATLSGAGDDVLMAAAVLAQSMPPVVMQQVEVPTRGVGLGRDEAGAGAARASVDVAALAGASAGETTAADVLQPAIAVGARREFEGKTGLGQVGRSAAEVGVAPAVSKGAGVSDGRHAAVAEVAVGETRTAAPLRGVEGAAVTTVASLDAGVEVARVENPGAALALDMEGVQTKPVEGVAGGGRANAPVAGVAMRSVDERAEAPASGSAVDFVKIPVEQTLVAVPVANEVEAGPTVRVEAYAVKQAESSSSAAVEASSLSLPSVVEGEPLSVAVVGRGAAKAVPAPASVDEQFLALVQGRAAKRDLSSAPDRRVEVASVQGASAAPASVAGGAERSSDHMAVASGSAAVDAVLAQVPVVESGAGNDAVVTAGPVAAGASVGLLVPDVPVVVSAIGPVIVGVAESVPTIVARQAVAKSEPVLPVAEMVVAAGENVAGVPERSKAIVRADGDSAKAYAPVGVGGGRVEMEAAPRPAVVKVAATVAAAPMVVDVKPQDVATKTDVNGATVAVVDRATLVQGSGPVVRATDQVVGTVVGAPVPVAEAAPQVVVVPASVVPEMSPAPARPVVDAPRAKEPVSAGAKVTESTAAAPVSAAVASVGTGEAAVVAVAAMPVAGAALVASAKSVVGSTALKGMSRTGLDEKGVRRSHGAASDKKSELPAGASTSTAVLSTNSSDARQAGDQGSDGDAMQGQGPGIASELPMHEPGVDLRVVAGAVPAHATPAIFANGMPGSKVGEHVGVVADAVAVPLQPIQTAKLIQGIGQTEMRVGMRTAEFGNVSIRTLSTAEAVSAQISVEHGDLAKALVNHIPEMQAKLSTGVSASVQVDMTGQGTGGSGHGSGTQGQADGSRGERQQGNGGEGTGYFSQGTRQQRYAPVAAVVAAGEGRGSARLDVRV